MKLNSIKLFTGISVAGLLFACVSFPSENIDPNKIAFGSILTPLSDKSKSVLVNPISHNSMTLFLT